MKKLLLITLVLSAMTGMVYGDIIETKDGRTLEGKVTVVGDTYVIECKGITVKESADNIAKWEKIATPEEEYAAKYEAMDKQDKAEVLNLIAWCKNKGLSKEIKHLYELVLKIDPNHTDANLYFDRVYHNGRWMEANDYHTAMGEVKNKDGKWVSLEQASMELAEADYKKFMEDMRTKATADIKLLSNENRTVAQEAYVRLVKEYDPHLPGLRHYARKVLNAADLGEVGDELKTVTLELHYAQATLEPFRIIGVGGGGGVVNTVSRRYDNQGHLINETVSRGTTSTSVQVELPVQRLLSGAATVAVPSW